MHVTRKYSSTVVQKTQSKYSKKRKYCNRERNLLSIEMHVLYGLKLRKKEKKVYFGFFVSDFNP